MSELLLILVVLMAFLFVGGIFFLLFKKFKTDQIQSDSIRDLERRLTDLMTIQLKEMRDSQEGSSRVMHDRIASFTREATRIREDLKQVQEAVKDVSSFQEIFRSPKLRGQWGEASLEHILSEHFPPELYKIQHMFSSGEQVDAVLKLPDGHLLPIDSKFPLENFTKMAESESPEEQKLFQKKFIEDVKLKINEIASKYILPGEGTVKYAFMYVPAETIYYEIAYNIGRDVDLNRYAWSKKIIITSPNIIFLHLKILQRWFLDTQISQKTQDILKRLGRIHQDATKLADSFRKLGAHLQNSLSAYNSSEKRLSLFSERVGKLLETQIPEQKKLPEPEED